MLNLPRYKCHKEVRAAKIEKVIHTSDGGADLVFFNRTLGLVHVGLAFLRKHLPQEGGYYVLYDDGYESWSPAKAFEDGYSIVQ